MTDLRRRLSSGEPPDFPATDGGLVTVATRAVRRRRARAAVTSLTAAALVSVAALAGGAGGGTAGLHPTAPYGGSPTPAAGGAPTPDAGGTSGTPGPVSPSPAPSEPGLSPSTYEKTPAPERTGTPAPEETTEPSESPTPGPTSGPPPDGVEQWHETVETVDDRPELGCYFPAEEKGGWCWRWSGTRSAPARQPVPFEFELCRRAPGTHGDRIDLDNDIELEVFVDYEQDARSADRRVAQPHSRTVPLGRCLRWTATWNGIAEDGYWARPGVYGVRIRVLGVMPYTDATGRQTRHGYPADWGRIELT